MGHRPMYCSNTDGDDCRYEDDLVRTGLPIIKKSVSFDSLQFSQIFNIKYNLSLFFRFGLEKLFYDHGVDLEIWAHEHSYERLWPVYNKEVKNGSLQAPYTDPKAPVHITTGSAVNTFRNMY